MKLSLQDEAILNFKYSGYTVVVFSPEELKGANPDIVEERLIQLGWSVISELSNKHNQIDQKLKESHENQQK